MAITDYTTLKGEVQAYCGRSDSTFAARFPMFVALAEDRIYLGHGADERDPLYSPAVRSSMMETAATVNLTSGTGPLPADYLDCRRISCAANPLGLDFMTPEQLTQRLANAPAGVPGYYTVEGDTIKVAPQYTGALDLLYNKRFPAITPDVITGSMIQEHGQLYFSAAMFEALSFMQEPELAMAWLSRFRSHAAGINKSAIEQRYAGRRLRIHARPIG